MATIHFYEKQFLRKWWIWLIVIVSSLVPLGMLIAITTKQITNASDHHAIIGLIIIATVISLSIIILLYKANLETEIDEHLIAYKYFPFHLSNKKIYWEDVNRAYVRKYSPIGDFGGWGLRYSFRKGKALNVSGNMGLQLELKNGKKILFGTQKKNELEELTKQLYAKNVVKE